MVNGYNLLCRNLKLLLNLRFTFKERILPSNLAQCIISLFESECVHGFSFDFLDFPRQILLKSHSFENSAKFSLLEVEWWWLRIMAFWLFDWLRFHSIPVFRQKVFGQRKPPLGLYPQIPIFKKKTQPTVICTHTQLLLYYDYIILYYIL